MKCGAPGPLPLGWMCREKEAPKVWQAREQTTYDDYDTVTVRRV